MILKRILLGFELKQQNQRHCFRKKLMRCISQEMNSLSLSKANCIRKLYLIGMLLLMRLVWKVFLTTPSLILELINKLRCQWLSLSHLATLYIVESKAVNYSLKDMIFRQFVSQPIACQAFTLIQTLIFNLIISLMVQ